MPPGRIRNSLESMVKGMKVDIVCGHEGSLTHETSFNPLLKLFSGLWWAMLHCIVTTVHPLSFQNVHLHVPGTYYVCYKRFSNGDTKHCISHKLYSNSLSLIHTLALGTSSMNSKRNFMRKLGDIGKNQSRWIAGSLFSKREPV